MDDPRRRAGRHVARRHQDIAFKLLEELQRHRGRRATSSRRSASRGWPRRSPTHIHFLCQALPIEDAEEHAGADHHRDAAPAGGVSELPAEHHLAERARQRRRHRRLRRSPPTSSDPISSRSRTTRSGRSTRRRSCRASPRPKINLNVSNPEVHVAVDRKRAADLGVRMATVGNTLRLAVSGDDQISLLQGRARSSTRSRCACSRASAATSRRSAASPCRRRPGRYASTTSRASSAASGRRRCSARTVSSRSASTPTSRLATPSTKRPATSAGCWPGSTCRRRCRSACRDSRRSSTRRRRT